MQLIKIAFVMLFFVLAIAPVTEWASGAIDVSALEEKRTLATPPDFIAKIFRGDGRLSNDINRWFDDHYGLRPLFVRLKNQLDYWMFRHSDKIYVGRDGWLYQPAFFTNMIAAERSGDASAQKIHERYQQLVAYLAKQDIRLVVVSNPEKMTIYPEYLPAAIPTIPQNNQFQKLRSWLKSRDDLIYVDGEDILKQKCPEYRTFLKLDIHMTLPGGVCFSREIVSRIAQAEGYKTSPWSHNFKYTITESSAGGQADFLSLLFPVFANNFSPDHLYGDNERGFATDPKRVYEWVYHAPVEEQSNRLPAVVLFGDSFLDHYRGAGFSSYFTDVSRARDSGQNFATVLENLPAGTRYFVFQFLEPYLLSIGFYQVPSAMLSPARGSPAPRAR